MWMPSTRKTTNQWRKESKTTEYGKISDSHGLVETT
jgi:hypothetical protein